MTIMLSEVRPGAYYDSVVLMQLQRALADLSGVEDAGVVMATPANCDLLVASDLAVETEAGSDDLLIVIKGIDQESAENALGQVDALLKRRRGGISQEFRPRSLSAAVKQLPDAQWVSISVPGRFAAGVAKDALNLNRHVFMFSDNVSLGDEIELKNLAQQKGLMMMGPDCGTAIVNGIGLGFANAVRTGPIGLVGASGTGLQAITSSIHNLGSGISQALGTGGRDLSLEVGGITTLQALELLSADEETKVIVIVSKPPKPEIVTKLLANALQIKKPVVVDFIGYPPASRRIANVYFATGLQDAASIAVELADSVTDQVAYGFDEEINSEPKGYIRGIFSGGTLAYEALLGLQAFVSPIYSNAPIYEYQRLSDVWKSHQHTLVDMGEDEFTQGRLHPMMDNDLRLRRLAQEAADPDVSIILLDVVLGSGSHDDPAAELGPAIMAAKESSQAHGRKLEILVIIVGTEEDSQALLEQEERLAAAGALVFRSTIEAVDYAIRRLAYPSPSGSLTIELEEFKKPLSVINVGLEIFYDSIKFQDADVVQVDWRPPAGGNEKLMALLAKMK